MPYQTGLPGALARFGLKVETVPGWETRGSSNFNPVGAMSHWTAGPRGTELRSSLNIVTHGRTGLPGPLCNVYLDRAGIAVVVAAGVANHGGVGTWRGWSGNSRFFGTEAECGGDNDWTAAQRAAYPRVNAAYCWLSRFGPDMCCGHNEYATPAGRKIDIRDWPMSLMRSQVAELLADPSANLGGFLMALTDQQQAEMYWWTKTVVDAMGLNGGLNTKTANSGLFLIRDNNARLKALATAIAQGSDVDEQAVANLLLPTLVDLVAKLVEQVNQEGGGVSEDRVRELAVQAVSDALAAA